MIHKVEPEFSPKQDEALKLLHSDVTHIMLSGGRRSGKTFIVLSDIFAACLQYPGLEALVARNTMSSVIKSVWGQTLPAVLKQYPTDVYSLDNSNFEVDFFNGSKIQLGGFDDKERIEKQLGLEFAIIYANECSLISYDAILLSRSSLAQVVPGFKNKFYYDMNPPPPTHWTYKVFIEGIDPKSGDQLPNNYRYLKMNPSDNPLLSTDYIEELKALPERERRRYLYGEFVKTEGAIYDAFDYDKHTILLDDLPPMEYYTVGIDNTGTNFAAVLIGWAGESIYILDEYSAYRETMQNFDATVQHKWRQYGYVAYPDPAAAQLNDLIWNAQRADNAVEPGINYIIDKMENNCFFLLKVVKDNKEICNTPNLLSELDSYRRDEKGRILKVMDHHCFTGDTLILMRDGVKQIKDVVEGDEVITPYGYKKVVDSMLTNKSAYINRYTQSNTTIYSTPDHPVYSNGVKTPIASAYSIESIKDLWKYNTSLRKKQKLLSSIMSDILNLIVTTEEVSIIKLDTYIEMFMNTIMGLYQKDTTYTISTVIKIITILKICSVSMQVHTQSFIHQMHLGLKQLVKLLKSGTNQNKEENNTQSIQENIGQNSSLRNVRYVINNILRRIVSTRRSRVDGPVQLLSETVKDTQAVYNLTIEDVHMYYANGLLVSNCDSLRYGVYSHARYGASILA